MNTSEQPPKAPRKTNWYVITGAPSSGKTSVINGLARRGYKVVPETARAYINGRLASGHTLTEIKTDILAFERHILMEKVRIERGLSKSETIFLDRAIPDSIAYFQLEGLDEQEPIQCSHILRYQQIFLFDRLTFEKDNVRSENQAVAARIETLLHRSYADLGYDVIRVPVLPVDQRIEFVLAHTVK